MFTIIIITRLGVQRPGAASPRLPLRCGAPGLAGGRRGALRRAAGGNRGAGGAGGGGNAAGDAV